MAIPSFIFGGDAAAKTPQELAQQRAVIHALMASQKAPRNVGEGLNALGDGIVANVLGRRADAAEAAGQSSAESAFSPIVGALAGFPAAPSGAGGSFSTADATPQPKPDNPNLPSSMDFAKAQAGGGDASELAAALSDPARRSRLPAGMRNNNPGNIKFVGQKVAGIVGPSQNTDQGDPQAVFDSPESGMRAMYGLLGRKYAGGKRTANDIIAGQGGWTPGNFQAAANVARAVGIRPDQDINFNDPNMAARFMRGLIAQEHGPASKLYPDSLILSAISGKPSIAPPAAANEAMATGQPIPTQVASNDPSAGVAQALAGQPEDINPVAAGQPVSGDPTTRRVLATMGNPQSMTGGAPLPLQGQPQQVAQAVPQPGPDLSRIPVTAGGNAGALPPGAAQAGPSIAQLLAAGGNEWLNKNQSAIVQALLGQKLKEQDPATALDREKTQLEIEQLRNPTAKPTSDMQNYDFYAAQERAAGRAPLSYNDWDLQSKRAGASSVNVDTKGETKFDQTMGEELAKKTIGILDAGQQAPSKIATYNQLLQTLPGMYTGTGGDTILNAKRALKGLGIDTGDLSGPEFVQAMGNQMALELRNPAGGAGMPGAMSDKDREFLTSMSPGLTKTPEGNKKLLEYRIAVEQRNQQVAQLANQYMNSHGGRIDNNFYSELSKWSDANPLFNQEPAAKKPIITDGYTIEEVE